MYKKLIILLPFLLLFPQITFASVCTQYITQSDNDIWGNAGTQRRMAQPFTVPSTCTVSSISVYIGKNNSPTDNVIISLYTDLAGSPGSLIEDGSPISGTGLTTGFTWETATFSGTTVLNPATTYWVYFGRSGSNDATNVYHDGIDNTSVLFSDYKVFNGVSWSAPSSGYNADFIINGLDTPTDVSTTTIVDNPALNIALSMALFLGFMWFSVWFFSKKR